MKNEIAALQAAKDAAGKLTSTEKLLRHEHAELLTERRRIAGTLRGANELVDDMRRLVDETAAIWAQTHAGGLASALNGREQLIGRSDRTRWIKPQLPNLNQPVSFKELCGVVPELMKN